MRYYIVDLTAGEVKGTDSTHDAENYAACCDFFVIDKEQDMWLMENGERKDILETGIVEDVGEEE